jgi:hypothetical protein
MTSQHSCHLPPFCLLLTVCLLACRNDALNNALKAEYAAKLASLQNELSEAHDKQRKAELRISALHSELTAATTAAPLTSVRIDPTPKRAAGTKAKSAADGYEMSELRPIGPRVGRSSSMSEVDHFAHDSHGVTVHNTNCCDRCLKSCSIM